jgi:dihydroxyacid dehydratase/phosphogluconate dehydratase
MNNALNRIYFHAMGLERADIDGPIVGVASAWNSSSAIADMPLRIARAVEEGIWAGGATPREFATIASAQDGPSQLMTRELVADSVELTMRGHSYDALVGVTGCPLAMAGLMLAMARLDVPSVLVPLGDDPEVLALADAAQVLGLATAGGVSEREAIEDGREAGELVAARLEEGVTPRQTITADALRAAATPEVAIHLAALARECGIELTLRDLVPDNWVQGTLAPEGALLTGAPASGTARVFDDEAAACEFLREGWTPGTVVVVRGQGPRGGPGMPALNELAAVAPAGAVLITDGRLPRIEGVACVSAVAPEAAAGGPIAGLSDGDMITLNGAVNADAAGSAAWPESRFTSAAMRKYARVVQPAHVGAATHPGAAGEVTRYGEL